MVTPDAPINSEESELGLEGFDFEEFEHDLINLVADDLSSIFQGMLL